MNSTSNLKVAMAQLNYKLNDFAGNTALICDALQSNADVDLIVFTELALSGYYPQDLVEEPDFLVKQQSALSAVLEASQRFADTYIAVGLVTENKGTGKPLRNSLHLIKNGQVLMQYDKQLLPTYNIFDERRHFEPGTPAQHSVVEIAGRKVGFIICEDGWNDEATDYAVNPVAQVIGQGAEVLISLNASPSNVGKLAQRHGLFSAVAQKYSVPVFYVNQVGAHDQIVFDGGSFIAAPTGIALQMPLFASAQTVASVSIHNDVRLVRGPAVDPVEAAGMNDSAFYYQQIVLGLRDYARKVGFKTVVVGSSGGIDSALTLALAADALGAENVKAITMPSRFSSSGSVGDSVTLCQNLGVELLTHEIATLYNDYQAGFTGVFGSEASRLTKENVQARIRGTILMEYSNHFGHLLLTTGNKSEISCGYFTLYGDSNGGLNLIGDLYKTEVFALSRYYNELHGREIIPNAIIDKAPSAELSEGQLDTDSLPPYPVLDEILKLAIEGPRLRPAEYAHAKAFVDEMRATGQGATIDRVQGLIKKSEFKRRQAPPIIRVRNRAFGNGRQIPIASA